MLLRGNAREASFRHFTPSAGAWRHNHLPTLLPYPLENGNQESLLLRNEPAKFFIHLLSDATAFEQLTHQQDATGAQRLQLINAGF
jgi:hypothetical protein